MGSMCSSKPKMYPQYIQPMAPAAQPAPVITETITTAPAPILAPPPIATGSPIVRDQPSEGPPSGPTVHQSSVELRSVDPFTDRWIGAPIGAPIGLPGARLYWFRLLKPILLNIKSSRSQSLSNYCFFQNCNHLNTYFSSGESDGSFSG